MITLGLVRPPGNSFRQVKIIEGGIEYGIKELKSIGVGNKFDLFRCQSMLETFMFFIIHAKWGITR